MSLTLQGDQVESQSSYDEDDSGISESYSSALGRSLEMSVREIFLHASSIPERLWPENPYKTVHHTSLCHCDGHLPDRMVKNENIRFLQESSIHVVFVFGILASPQRHEILHLAPYTQQNKPYGKKELWYVNSRSDTSWLVP